MSKREDKRQYTRHIHRGYGTLVHQDNKFSCHLINLSEAGALIALLDEYHVNINEKVTLFVEIGDGDVAEMAGQVAHCKDHFIGLSCVPVKASDREKLKPLLT